MIMWYRNSELIFQDSIRFGNVGSNIIRQNDRSLLINNVTEADVGVYRCEILKGETGNPSVAHMVILETSPYNISIAVKDNIREVSSI